MHEEIINQVVEEYKKKPHVIAILLYGSHALGIAKPDSDIDIYVVTNRRVAQRSKKTTIKGVEVGIMVHHFAWLVPQIVYRYKPVLVRNYKESKILHCTDAGVKFIKKLAEIVFKEGARPANETSIIFMRKRITHLAGDSVKLAAKDPLTALHVMNVAFHTIITTYYRLHLWVRTKRTYVLKEIKKGDNFFYQLITEYLKEYDPPKKAIILDKMAQYTLEPVGGFLPDEWEVPVKTAEEIQIEENVTNEEMMAADEAEEPEEL
jgi:predicted nucleotidyltransferase